MHGGNACHYSGKVARSPLTRAYAPLLLRPRSRITLCRYLTGVEKRLHGVESLLSQLLPGVKIDDALASPNLLIQSAPSIGTPRTPEASLPTTALSPQGSSTSAANEPILPEAVPDSVDGFNWQEENVTVDILTDGMAALSVEPTGVGYLGQHTRFNLSVSA